MIFNKHLDLLLEVEIVQAFMQKHSMMGKSCSSGEDYGFLLYKLPYVVEFHDALIENYLEITLSDLESCLLIQGGSSLGCSLDLGLQNLEELRGRDFLHHPKNEIFLSYGAEKMGYLQSDFQAIDKLLPLIKEKGGLSSMRDGTFDGRFDFSDSVQPMYPGLKEKYLRCIGRS